MHFTTHITEAMHINRRRAALYAARSDGLSHPASSWLLAIESAMLPVARWFDGRPWSDALADAFVPMTAIAPVEQPSHYRSGGTVAGFWRTLWLSVRCQRALLGPCIRAEWQQTEVLAEAALRQIRTLEDELDVHLAMLVHFVESVARAAWLAPTLPNSHNGRALVGVQVAALPLAVFLDRLAWPAQARGVGILVNDLPNCLPPQSVAC